MPDTNELSERELEILELVATGASNKEIAQQLYISANTVKVHLRNIFAKIEVTTRTEAAMYAVQSGLVPATPEQDSVAQGAPDAGQEDTQPEASTWRVYAWWGVVAVVVILALAGVLYLATRRPPEAVSASPAAPQVEARWQIKAQMLTPRSGLALAAYEEQLYAIGGEAGGQVSGSVEVFNPNLNEWQALSDKPTPVADVAAVVIGGKVYVPGGRLLSGEMSPALEVYDPLQDAWESGAKLPQAVSAYALAVIEGKLYLFGGWDGQEYLDIAWRYDPGTDRWEVLHSMPTRRAYAGAATAAGRIFVIGGYDGQGALQEVEIYQPAKEQDDTPWTYGLPIPDGRYAMGVTSAVDIIYLVGGVSNADRDAALPSLEYIPSAGLWQEFDSPVTGSWAHMGMVLSGTQIYVLGGELDGQPTDQNIAYQAIYTVSIPSIIK